MSEQSTFQSVILAAGKGTRMKSSTIKILHAILDRPLIDWVVETAFAAGSEQVIAVLGHDKERVEEHLKGNAEAERIVVAHQAEQRGTGHAVYCAREQLERAGAHYTLILSGDVPNLSLENLQRFIEAALEEKRPVSLITAVLDDPAGYGRIERDEYGEPVAIVEAKDASPDQLLIKEINTGIYLMRTEFMLCELDELMARPIHNKQNEFYLTDLIAAAAPHGGVFCWAIDDMRETIGVNTRADLAQAAAYAQERINTRWMEEGVTFIDPRATFVGPEVELAADVTLYPNVHLQGKTRVGEGSVIEPGCFVKDAEIGAECHLKASCYVTEARLEAHVSIGPFAHLRPGADLGEGCKVGNFVELKKTRMEPGAKASHLTYLGDAHVGAKANVGAGTITCNYDGVNKHETVIGAGAFIGSNTALVAPITIGDGAYVGAGSTLTNDVPERALGVARGRQRVIEGWVDRTKKSR